MPLSLSGCIIAIHTAWVAFKESSEALNTSERNIQATEWYQKERKKKKKTHPEYVTS